MKKIIFAAVAVIMAFPASAQYWSPTMPSGETMEQWQARQSQIQANTAIVEMNKRQEQQAQQDAYERSINEMKKMNEEISREINPRYQK